MSTRSQYLDMAEDLMNRLSDIHLEPHPHFRVLPAVFEEDAPRVWEIESKNEVGYIFEDRSSKNKAYTTRIDFKLRTGSDIYVPVKIAITKRVADPSVEAVVSVGAGTESTSKNPGRELTLNVPAIPGDGSGTVILRVVKDVKETAEGSKVIFKLANETASSRIKDGQKSFEFGHLLDFSVAETSDSPLETRLEAIKGYGLVPRQDEDSRGGIRFRDYLISEVKVPSVKSTGRTIDAVTKTIGADVGVELHSDLVGYLKSQFENKGWTLYGFQERAIKEILAQSKSSRRPIVIIARTAAGKTEAFLIPVLNEILWLKEAPSVGVKAVFFYPTKALASDQLQRILEVLYWLNKSRENPITIGVYHGDIEENIYLDIPLPLRCVLHNEELSAGKLRSGQVRLVYDKEKQSLACKHCGEAYPFLLLDRFRVTLELPDILVCTPDVINWILLNDQKRHTILGRAGPVRVCENCKRIVDITEKVCEDCQSPTKLRQVTPQAAPQIVVLDELHLFQSVFGGNVSLLLRRFQAAVRKYVEEAKAPSKPILFIATSATIRNPHNFGREFFGRDVSLIEADQAEYDYSKAFSKAVVFASPRAYRMIDTVGYSILEALRSTDLRILTFVNTLPVCDSILNNVRYRLSAEPSLTGLIDQLDGHNSNLTKQQRANTEERFNEGKIRVLVATSTLEVGVDFKDLDGLILYGAPYNFNNYLQRMGRAGRRNDALIFNVLSPTDPIDISYFRNSLNISKDPTSFIEYPPFPEDNDMILSRQELASVYDAANLFSLDVEDVLRGFQIGQPEKSVESYAREMWGNEGLDRIMALIKTETIGLVALGNPIARALQEKLHLSDLRKIEDTVPVQFEESGFRAGGGSAGWRGGQRPREDPRSAAYRRAGLSRRDIDTLKELKGE